MVVQCCWNQRAIATEEDAECSPSESGLDLDNYMEVMLKRGFREDC